MAELYGVWLLNKLAVRRQTPQVLMLQDNTAAVWGTLNLKSHAPFWTWPSPPAALRRWRCPGLESRT